jgi:predicted nucleic acid-binding protein
MPVSLPAYLLDTSVVVKWFVQRGEADVERARELRAAHRDVRCRLLVPDLLLLELANALLAGHRYSAGQVHQASEAMQRVGLETLPMLPETLNHAVSLAAASRVTVYDSYFLAAAVESRAILVTADEVFLRRMGPHPSVLALRDLRLPIDWQ